MSGKSVKSRRSSRDPDDAPQLTRQWVEEANLFHGRKLVRRGRPPAAVHKVSTTLRLSPEVIEHFRSGGAGWQTRIDEALKRVVARASPTSRR
jgi:uncharacterized protein (DUF4415 family)